MLEINHDKNYSYIFEEILNERYAQVEEWGGPDVDDSNSKFDWIAYITKHLGKAITNPFNIETFRYQLIRVATLAIAAIASIDRERVKYNDRG